MLTIDLTSMNVLDDQGKNLGHVVDFIRNGSVLMLQNIASLKGQLDVAWINREAQQRDTVRTKDEALSAVLDAHEDDATGVTLSDDLAAHVKQAKSAK